MLVVILVCIMNLLIVWEFVHFLVKNQYWRLPQKNKKNILKRYGYQRGDLIYYKLTDMSLNDGLVQLKTDKDVLKIMDYHKSETIVVVYTISAQVLYL